MGRSRQKDATALASLDPDAPLMGAARPRRRSLFRRRSAVPGFGLTFGITLLALSLVVLVPLSSVAVRAAGLGWDGFAQAAFSRRALLAYRLSFGAALVGAAVNGVFGALTAWALVRYRFPGKTLLNGLVDLPFALPTAVAGISLATLYAPNGLFGGLLARAGIKAAYSPLGVVVALTFIGLPFVVRTIEPVLRDFSSEVEEASATLGAGRLQTIVRVVAPALVPAWLTGFALAFARGVGEYGSVIFIAGNMPFRTEIAPLLITMQLEQFNYETASAIAVVMLAFSFLLLLLINAVQAWSRRHEG